MPHTSSPNGAHYPVDRFLHVYLCGERHECTLRDRLIGRAISIATRSPWVHVAVGYNGAVVSVHDAGAVYWPRITWEEYYPARMLRYGVPNNGDIDLDDPSIRDATGMGWRSIARWLTNGRFTAGLDHAADDCVQQARRALWRAGWYAPKTVTTPERLRRWLDEHGFGHVDNGLVPGRIAAAVQGAC